MRVLVLTAAASLSACAAANTPSACRITLVAEVPIQMVDSVPLVDVGFDGHPAKLVLDTGAEQVIVRDKSVERLGLELNYQALASVTGIGGQSSIFPSRPATLSIGPVRLPPEALLVTAMPISLRGGIEPDGLLGSQVLSAYDVDIDMPSRRLGLYERRRCPDGPPPIEGATNTIQAQGNRAWKLSVPVTLDGVALDALVDTGATRTLVDSSVAGLTEADLSGDRSLHLAGADPVGLGGHLHRFKQLQVGSETVANPLLAVAPFKNAGYSALLGTDYWRYRRVWISYGSRTVTVGPRQPRPR